jgi:heat-inducible transcriptional repressor
MPSHGLGGAPGGSVYPMHARRDRILHLVAEGYVRTARPVPSSSVAAVLDVSSATVRNAFGALEDEGLLQQPHASAGRIPTSLGFRRYAHDLLPPAPLAPAALEALRVRFSASHGDALLQQLAQAAAELSGYAVVVSLPADDQLHALEIHLSLLHARALLAVVVLENGLVRQVRVDLDPSPDDQVLDGAERQLRQLTLPVAAVPLALTELARDAEPELARTLLAIRAAWPAVSPPRTIVAGLTGVLQEPEAHDPAFVRLLVGRVERPWSDTDAEDQDEDATEDAGLGLAWDEALAMVRARWRAGATHGHLTLVGPARMRYGPALQVVGGVTSALKAAVAAEGFARPDG